MNTPTPRNPTDGTPVGNDEYVNNDHDGKQKAFGHVDHGPHKHEAPPEETKEEDVTEIPNSPGPETESEKPSLKEKIFGNKKKK